MPLAYGGTGNDILFGGPGSDVLSDWTESDTFVFRSGYEDDEVTDFDINFDFVQLDEAFWGGGLNAGQVVSTFADDSGADAIFDFGDGDILRLLSAQDADDLISQILF